MADPSRQLWILRRESSWQTWGWLGSTVDLEEVTHEAEKVTESKQRKDLLDQQLGRKFSVEALTEKMVVQLMQCACEEQVGNQIIEPVLDRLCPQVTPLGSEQCFDHFWSS